MIPSPLWNPFTPMAAHTAEGVPTIAAADGFELIDTRGRRYLDGVSSLWCNVHGHRVPEIDAAVRDQLGRVAHSTLLGLNGEPADRLARELVRVAPAGGGDPLTRVFFSDSGATAVEVALKMAYQYHRQKPSPERRDLFVRFANAYHGDTVGTTAVGGIDLFHGIYGDLLFESVTVPSPAGLRLPPDHDRDSYPRWCLEETRRILSQHAGRVAAVVMEPLVQGAAGILVHPPGYLRSVRDLTREFDVPLIADEVAVGFGKTGRTFACEHEGVVPDFLCLAKGLTGGYLPVAATLTTERVYEAFLGEPHAHRTFFHGHTFTGNALGCAAALASLAKFEADDCPANAPPPLRADGRKARRTDRPPARGRGPPVRGDGRHRTGRRPRHLGAVPPRPPHRPPRDAGGPRPRRDPPPAGRYGRADASRGDAGQTGRPAVRRGDRQHPRRDQFITAPRLAVAVRRCGRCCGVQPPQNSPCNPFTIDPVNFPNPASPDFGGATISACPGLLPSGSSATTSNPNARPSREVNPRICSADAVRKVVVVGRPCRSRRTCSVVKFSRQTESPASSFRSLKFRDVGASGGSK